MNRLNLHDGPAQAVGQAARAISTLIDLSQVLLGGGTALEARWHHRTSTDLDFFATGEEVDALFYDVERFASMLEDLWIRGWINGVPPTVTQRTVLHFEIDGTPVSLGRVDGFEGNSDDVELQTGITLATNEYVLTKKLVNRLLGNGTATERDAYDFLVAKHLDPEALEYAWRKVPLANRATITATIASRLNVPGPPPAESRGLTGLAYPGLAESLWENLIELFHSDLDRIPPLHGTHEPNP
ncbi:MAG: nucleotidyl transferase AbiEii/AbiGii toxin family protein [Gammaproteobacteria bacterium]|nr:nucleotidyl transferase AbiEii/AbiGii toxin family protein [Gammaproteobacteria bacterium]